jgi:RNA-directed DNA polymerase
MAQQARGSPAMVCHKVLHWIDRACLREASHQTQQRSAPGMDHVTAQQDAARLDENLRDLHERLRDKRSVAPPVERVWIAKDEGKKRPIGKPCVEDKSVQRAVVLLEAIFAQDVHACSHGFRKGHRPHQARHELREQCRTWPITWRVEAEVRGCFDHVDWSHLRECLQQRVSEGGRRRRMGTWRHAGVREAGALRHPDKGTPQGGVRSPM